MNMADLFQYQYDDELGWHFGPFVPVPVFGSDLRRFVLSGLNGDPQPEQFFAALLNMMALTPGILVDASPHAFRYYRDICHLVGEGELPSIVDERAVWDHVHFGQDLLVERRFADSQIYISCECSCDWESEHGLQVVFRNGLELCKVGPYDGHVTNEDAYGDARFRNVVYVSNEMLG
jgi:hypothetical protein